MIILLVILAIIAIAGFVITTALRKGLDSQDAYDRDRLKLHQQNGIRIKR